MKKRIFISVFAIAVMTGIIEFAYAVSDVACNTPRRVTADETSILYESYDREGWSISGCSEHNSGSDGPFTYIIDDSPNTHWHTKWSGNGSDTQAPHFFVVDMMPERPDSMFEIAAFSYKRRLSTSSDNGTCQSYRFYVLNDISSLVTNQGGASHESAEQLVEGVMPDAQGTFDFSTNPDEPRMVQLSSPTRGHYALFIMDETVGSHGSCSDFNIYRMRNLQQAFDSRLDSMRNTLTTLNSLGITQPADEFEYTISNIEDYNKACAVLDSILALSGQTYALRNNQGLYLSQIPTDSSVASTIEVENLDAMGLWSLYCTADTVYFCSDASHKVISEFNGYRAEGGHELKDFFVTPEVSREKIYKIICNRAMTTFPDFAGADTRGKYLRISSTGSLVGSKLVNGIVDVCAYWRLRDSDDGKVIIQNVSTLMELGANMPEMLDTVRATEAGTPLYILPLTNMASDGRLSIHQSFCMSSEVPYTSTSCMDLSIGGTEGYSILNCWSPTSDNRDNLEYNNGSIWYFVEASEAETKAVRDITVSKSITNVMIENGSLIDNFHSNSPNYYHGWESESSDPKVTVMCGARNFEKGTSGPLIYYAAGQQNITLSVSEGWKILNYSFIAKRKEGNTSSYTISTNGRETHNLDDENTTVVASVNVNDDEECIIRIIGANQGVILNNFKITAVPVTSLATIQSRFDSEVLHIRNKYLSARGTIHALYNTELWNEAMAAIDTIATDVYFCESIAEIKNELSRYERSMAEIMNPILSAASGAVITLQNRTYGDFLSSTDANLIPSSNLSDSCRWELKYLGEGLYTLYNRTAGRYMGVNSTTFQPWPTATDAFEAGKFRLKGTGNSEILDVINLELNDSVITQRVIHEDLNSKIVVWDSMETTTYVNPSAWSLALVDRVSDTGDNDANRRPDLRIANVTVVGDTVAGADVALSYTLSNVGEATATAPWTEHVWLVADGIGSINESTAIKLGVVSSTQSMEAGRDTTKTVTVTLPTNKFGKYRIVVTADVRDIKSFIPEVLPDVCPEGLKATVDATQRTLSEPDESPSITDNIGYATISIAQLRESEWQLLKSMSSRAATPMWNMEAGRHNTILSNITVNAGYVTSFEITNRNLDMEFPEEIFAMQHLTSFNLSNTHLRGDIAARLNIHHVHPTVTGVHVSNNNLTGNGAQLTKRFSKAQTIRADHNAISELAPAPTNSGFNFTYQTLIDTIDVDIRLMHNPQLFAAHFPTLFIYPALASVSASYTISNPENGNVISHINYNHSNQTFTPYYSATTYYGQSGDPISIMISDNRNMVSNSTAPGRLFFAAGDANFDGLVNVADLQSLVVYMYGNYQSLFNYTAANLYVDERLNVQDVVMMVDLLLADNNVAPTKVRARIDSAATSDVEPTPEATLTWHNGNLIVTSETEIGAIDIIIESIEAINWAALPKGMVSSSSRREDGSCHVIIYSPIGETFKPGNNIIGTTSTGSSPRIKRVDIVDKSARILNTSVSDSKPSSIYEIPDTSEDYTSFEIHDTSGRLITGGQIDANNEENLSRITKSLNNGVYFITKKSASGKNVITHKLIINHN